MLMNDYRSPWLTPELDTFRETTRRFWHGELLPHVDRWEKQGYIDREVWHRLGHLGLLLADVPAAYGGGGGDYRHLASLIEVSATAGFGLGFGPHYIVAQYLLAYASEAQKQRWLPKLASGEMVASIAMSEPGAGSDLAALRTTARREGEHYVINGAKTFNTNGHHADLILIAAKTDPAKGARGVSLIVAETKELPGFRRGRLLDKIGLKAQDTLELFFDDMRVPAENLVGGAEGLGFGQMMEQLPYERTTIAIRAVASTERALALTLDHVKTRQLFGNPLLKMQNTRFEMSEMKTQASLARVFIDQCIQWQLEGRLDAPTAAMAKLWSTENECQTIDRCLQLFGGYGFMREFPIARMYVDSRAQRIYGGANEVMKEIIARQL
ncbi:acyl-CoA dehydrogenase family protein [Cupriavidus necator]|uniref:Acyl-[acyl-carrier-protein] dehydrogenase MbtN n=1 Tax=Cupriavidus necator TaxID=106590 RepID=A0A367PHX5_CUPNE|nr:acyl-CoA dehydrogenase family protein [Cupriavidus necator]QQX82788.1 acyl-CoA dehydrogenase family protein [Cupriavidus necator]RCJ07472.1 acyl-CoA dehydrogenase [Cupriavidus necator]